MIDFIKINNLPVEVDEILNNHALTFPLSNVATTGEILNRSQIAFWNDMQIKVKGEKVSLKGSLHKCHEGGTNHRDFSLLNVQSVIDEITRVFSFDPNEAIINFIEVGINLTTWCDPNKIIKSMILYRTNAFQQLQVVGKGFGAVCQCQQFDIKVYNKGLQFDLNENLLRFEIKVKRVKFLERFGIKGLSLSDLCNLTVWEKLSKMLFDILSGVLIANQENNLFDLTGIKDQELMFAGRFPQFWLEMERSKRHRLQKRFAELSKCNESRQRISDLIEKKCNKITDKVSSHHGSQVEQNNPTINSYSSTICSVTGLEMINQKPASGYLTTQGILWYFLFEPEIYYSRLEKLLTEKWKNIHRDQKLNVWFKAIAHKIRCSISNRKRNPINNAKKSFQNIEKKGYKLWPTESLISPIKWALIKL
ncbi:MAG: hypothetical protein HN686_06680 [Bacteroidetes bacterium]|jgi:hypothetical protein|nr:hypothetical protein [Bacteroidota bacterium]